jgi:hypothetical protein
MEMSGQHHAPAALLPGKQPPYTHCIGGSVGSRAGLGDVDKRKISWGGGDDTKFHIKATAKGKGQPKWYEAKRACKQVNDVD